MTYPVLALELVHLGAAGLGVYVFPCLDPFGFVIGRSLLISTMAIDLKVKIYNAEGNETNQTKK